MTQVSKKETIEHLSFQCAYMTPLRKARQNKGMTIYDLAKKAGIRPPSVSRIERGYPTSARTAERLARAVGIKEDRVLYPQRFMK